MPILAQRRQKQQCNVSNKIFFLHRNPIHLSIFLHYMMLPSGVFKDPDTDIFARSGSGFKTKGAEFEKKY